MFLYKRLILSRCSIATYGQLSNFPNKKDSRRSLFWVLLEGVVEFYAPCVVRIFDRRAVDSICFACKVVVSVEFYVLLKSYACTCYPELHVCAVKQALPMAQLT